MNKEKLMQMNGSGLPEGKTFWAVALALALVMAVTRLGHFGEYGGPLDASWAVFFLAGLWLRDLRLFPGFFVLAWVVDLAAFALGTPTDCYSPAYLFLVPAYGSLWMAGRWASGAGYARIVAGVVAGSVATFVIANLGMYVFAPASTAATPAAFASAVAGYFPGYLMTASVYVAVGLVGEFLVGMRRRVIA